MYQPPLIQFDFKGYTITSDKNLLQPEAIHHWLATESHWVQGIPFEVVQRAIENSFCVGALLEGKQIGFARLITDYTAIGYLADVYVEQAHRKLGLAKAMCGAIVDQDWAKQLRRILLATKDAHTVYEPLGFGAPLYPERFMEIIRPNPYQP